MNDENYSLSDGIRPDDQIAQWRALANQLQAELNALRENVTCEYCGATWSAFEDPDDHWRDCVRHPARAELQELIDERDAYKRLASAWGRSARDWRACWHGASATVEDLHRDLIEAVLDQPKELKHLRKLLTETQAERARLQAELDLQREALRHIILEIFGEALAEDEHTSVGAICEWIRGLRTENTNMKAERDTAMADARALANELKRLRNMPYVPAIYLTHTDDVLNAIGVKDWERKVDPIEETQITIDNELINLDDEP